MWFEMKKCKKAVGKPGRQGKEGNVDKPQPAASRAQKAPAPPTQTGLQATAYYEHTVQVAVKTAQLFAVSFQRLVEKMKTAFCPNCVAGRPYESREN